MKTKAIEWRLCALFCVLVAVLAWGCSGGGGDNPSPAPPGSGGASAGGSSGGGSGGSSGSSGTGGVSGSDSGDTGGSSGTGGGSGKGGTSGSGGSQPDGSDADASETSETGGSSGSSGDASAEESAAGKGGSSGSSSDASTDEGASGSAGTGGSQPDGGDADGTYAETDSAPADGGDAGDGDAKSEPPPPKPFKCSGWTRDLTFPSGLDLTGDIWGSGPNDIYVATGKYDTGEMAHYDGANWSLMTLPDVTGESWSHMISVWGASVNDVWAGGNTRPQGKEPKPRLLRRQNSSAWNLDPSLPLINGTDSFVRSIWGANSTDIFALVDVNYGLASSWDAKIFRRNGDGSWLPMTLPPHAPPFSMNRIWGKSASEVYVVGTRLDAQKNPIKAILWKYDGAAWQDISNFPADVVDLGGVYGTGSETVVVGFYKDGANYRGVVFWSGDLMSWSRYNFTTIQAMSSVWSPWQGAFLAAGSGLVPTYGSARLAVASLGVWAEGPIDTKTSDPVAIWPVPGQSQVWLAVYGPDSGMAGVYKGTCQ